MRLLPGEISLTEEVIQLTDQDLEIMECLYADARMPVLKLATALGMPESTVRARLNRLIANDVIHFNATSNPAKLGYKVWVMIGLEVELSHVDEIADRLGELDFVYFIALSTGGHDLMIAAVFKDNDEFVEFLTSQLGAVAGVRKVVTYNFLKIFKRRANFLPLYPTG